MKGAGRVSDSFISFTQFVMYLKCSINKSLKALFDNGYSVVVLCLLIFLFFVNVSCSSGWPSSHYVTEDNQLLIILPSLPKYRDLRSPLPCPIVHRILTFSFKSAKYPVL